MPTVVIHPEMGSFGLSRKAWKWLSERGHPVAIREDEDMNDPEISRIFEHGYESHCSSIERTDPLLIECVKTLGDEAGPSNGFGNGRKKLAMIEIPDGVEFYVDADGELGSEWVAEKHRRWSEDGELKRQ